MLRGAYDTVLPIQSSLLVYALIVCDCAVRLCLLIVCCIVSHAEDAASCMG